MNEMTYKEALTGCRDMWEILQTRYSQGLASSSLADEKEVVAEQMGVEWHYNCGRAVENCS